MCIQFESVSDFLQHSGTITLVQFICVYCVNRAQVTD